MICSSFFNFPKKVYGINKLLLNIVDKLMLETTIIEMAAENPQPPTRIRAGEAALVLPTQNIEELYKKIVAAGCTIINPPARIGVPGRPMAVLEMFCRDPDGILVNLTQRVAA